MREYVEPVMTVKRISFADIIVTSVGELTNGNVDNGAGLNGNDKETHNGFWGDE